MKFISLTFDDGWKSAITAALPLLQKYEMPATFYIVSSYVETEHPGYMGLEDLRRLSACGHEIGSHTRSHKHLPDLPDKEIWEEISRGSEDLLKWGFKPRTFAYPYGEWNPYVQKQVRESGFFAARSIERGVNDEKTNPFLLRALAVRENHSAAEVCRWLSDFTQGEGKWLILYFHQIEPAHVLRERKWIYGTTPEVLESTLRFLKEKQIRVTTLEDGMELLSSGQY